MIVDEETYLEHYGTKGMKWGVRRHRSPRPKQGKTPKETLEKRVKRADAVNAQVKDAQSRGKLPFTVGVNPSPAALFTPSLRSASMARLWYTGEGFTKRINKEYGGTAYKDILAGEGVGLRKNGQKYLLPDAPKKKKGK